ncbi:MAG: transposase [Ruminococcus sp.]|nr:transposase [Ruminococcus sp.]
MRFARLTIPYRQAFLGDFSGYLHTDGYAGYNKLTKVTHYNCWAHLRRKFHEAIVVNSENSIARTGRDFCDKLFAIEAELDSLTSEERYNKRLTQEKPVFEAFWSWAEKTGFSATRLRVLISTVS